MGQERREIELRMSRDPRGVLELGLARGIEDDELVVGARQHTMCGCQHEIARDRDAAAGSAARAHQEYDMLRNRGIGRLRAPHHAEGQVGGREDNEAKSKRCAVRVHAHRST
jgi:hypothetical protein